MFKNERIECCVEIEPDSHECRSLWPILVELPQVFIIGSIWQKGPTRAEIRPRVGT